MSWLRSEAHEEVTEGQEGLLEVIRLEMMAKSIKTVTGTKSWRKRVPDLLDVTVKLQVPNVV